MLFSNSSLQLSDQVRTFYQFHVYYTTRKILYEMGGIQSKNALPDDPAFNQKNNPYDVASYKRICAEFGVDPSTDFRFTYGQNHGLGYVNIMYSDGPFAQRSGNTPQLTCPILPVKGSLVIVVQRAITPSPLSETTRARTRSSSTLCRRKPVV